MFANDSGSAKFENNNGDGDDDGDDDDEGEDGRVIELKTGKNRYRNKDSNRKLQDFTVSILRSLLTLDVSQGWDSKTN